MITDRKLYINDNPQTGNLCIILGYCADKELGIKLKKNNVNLNPIILPIGEITSDIVIKQTFKANYNNLAEISIFFATYCDRNNTGIIKLQLFNENDVLINENQLRADTLKDNSYTDYIFESIIDSQGKYYSIVITSPDSTPGNAVTIYKTNSDEYIQKEKIILPPRDYESEYQNFRSTYQVEKLPKLALYRPDYPYGECAVIVDNRNNGITYTEKLDLFCSHENMNKFNANGATVLSILKPQTDKNGATYIFSGVTRWKDKLIFGVDDIQKYDISVEELREGIGEFELLLLKDGKIQLSTDFFGMCQWFYYKSDDGMFTAATSYHLLLLTLKVCGIKMRIDTKKIAAGMAFFHPYAQTSFSDYMDVENCFRLPADKKIVINLNDEPVFENTGLYQEVYMPEPYSEEAYEKYLFQAKDEIIANIRATLEHPYFNYVLCDLSGGFDSRMVLASALNLPHNLTQKIRINSNPKMSEDFNIAVAITNACGFKWDNIPREISCEGFGISDGEMHKAQQSYNLGTYYMPHNKPNFEKKVNTIQLTGGCGEVMVRDLPAIFWPGFDFTKGEESILSRKDFCKGDMLDIDYLLNVGKAYNAYIRNGLSKLPETTFQEKLDLFYLYNRNRHHFKTKYNKSCPKWTPLQSKIAFHCKRMYFKHISVDDKFQFDIISLLSPLLANFPYDNKYGQNKKQIYINLKDRLYRKGFPQVEIVPDYKTTEYQTTTKEEVYISDKQTVDAVKEAVEEWYTSEKTLLSALKVFLDYSNEFNELGLPLYKYFTSDRYYTQNQYVHAENVMINRILQAYWQIQIVEE